MRKSCLSSDDWRKNVQADQSRKKCARDGAREVQNNGLHSSGGPKSSGSRERILVPLLLGISLRKIVFH